MNEVLRKCKYKVKKNEVAILQKTLWVASFPQPGLQWIAWKANIFLTYMYLNMNIECEAKENLAFSSSSWKA